jgi:ubiquinone/menaquinone biosynthesis C-methylase UbiE
MKRFLLVGLFAAALAAQVAEKANERYRTPGGRAAIAQTLDGPDRDARQKPVELVQAMDLKPGMVVADLGTGVGYMLPFLSKAVGSSGKVIAEDIETDFLEKAKEKARREKLANVSFVKGTDTDPKLPENGVDVVLALDAYHHFDYPERMLENIRKGLRPAGRLVIVDFYKRPEAMPGGRAMEHIRLDQDDVIKEVEANGFRFISVREHIVKSQYMATFEKK